MLFKQTDDIYMSSVSFTPIGNFDNNSFQGTYDGDGYVILNISYYGNNYGYAGLFGLLKGGTVRNVNLKDCSFNGRDAGGIAGKSSDGTIDNCAVIGGTVSCGMNKYSGGIVGDNSEGMVKNCFTTTTVSANPARSDQNGPIIGRNVSNQTPENNYYTVAVSDGRANVGTEISGGFITAGEGVTIGTGVFHTIGKTEANTYYYGKQDDAITFSAEVPASGMKKFTTTAVTLSGTTSAGTVTLTMPASDVTVGLESVTLTVDDIAEQTYIGSVVKPDVTVKDGDATLSAETHYTVSYSNNTVVGTATVTITGKGIYLGTASQTFKITPKVTKLGALTLTEDQNGVTAEIDGNSIESLSIDSDNDIKVKSVTYSRKFVNDGGAYTIMLPFRFTVTNAVKGTFHTLSSIAPTAENPAVWKAEMSDDIATIEANTPYIFKPSEDIDKMLFENVTLEATTSPSLTFTNACENTNWKLHGVYSQKVWTDADGNEYGFAAAAKEEISVGEFVHFVTRAYLKPTRCYLEYSEDGFSKSAVVLPERIIVVFPETSSVIEPNDPENNNGDVITPVSEIAPNSGVKVWAADKTIVIESKAGDQYRIIDLNGRTLRESRLAADREEVTLSRAAGIVVVIVNGKTFKINY